MIWIPQSVIDFIREWMPLPCVEAVIMNRKHQVLLLKRRYAPAKGEWQFPGGLVKKEDGEPEEFVIQKAKEETGLDVFSPKLVGACHYKFPEGHALSVFFMVQTNSEDVVMDSQHSEYKWISETSPEYHPQINNILERIWGGEKRE